MIWEALSTVLLATISKPPEVVLCHNIILGYTSISQPEGRQLIIYCVYPMDCNISILLVGRCTGTLGWSEC